MTPKEDGGKVLSLADAKAMKAEWKAFGTDGKFFTTVKDGSRYLITASDMEKMEK